MNDKTVAEIQQDSERKRPVVARHVFDRRFVNFCVSTAFVSVVILAVLLISILVQGVGRINWNFLSAPPSSLNADNAGIRPALFGSLWVCFVCALFALPIGVSTAIFLEEFKPRVKAMRLFHGFIQLNINNLAGVPSVVYGIIGLTAFANMFGLFGKSSDEPVFEIGVSYYDQFVTEGKEFKIDGKWRTRGRGILRIPVTRSEHGTTVPTEGMTAYTSKGQKVEVHVVERRSELPDDIALLRHTLVADQKAIPRRNPSWYYFRIPFDRCVLTGGLTLMLVILPIVIIASQEAFRAVPDSLREGSLGMGCTQWQTVWNVTLPAAIPGVMTGSILAMSRAIGEAAPILMISGIVWIAANPGNLMDDFAIMPLLIYGWMAESREEFHSVAAGGIIVLLTVLLSLNGIAVFIRHRFRVPLT